MLCAEVRFSIFRPRSDQNDHPKNALLTAIPKATDAANKIATHGSHCVIRAYGQFATLRLFLSNIPLRASFQRGFGWQFGEMDAA